MAALSVTTTAQKIPVCIEVQNLGTGPVYLDNTDRVTSSSGIRLDPGGVLNRLKLSNDLWVVAGSGTQDVRYIA